MYDLLKKRGLSGPWMGVTAGCLIAGFVGVAYLRAASESGARKHDAADTANLGQAPATDAFHQSYQLKLEEMITQRLQKFQEDEAKKQQAIADQQKLAMDRIEAMARAVAAQKAATAGSPYGTATAGPPASTPSTAFQATKVTFTKDPASGAGAAAAETFIGTPSDITGSGTHDGGQTAPSSGMAKPMRDAYLIPEAGWVKGRLINGVIGAQDGDFRYTEIKLTGVYHGPNNYVQSLDGCVVTGEARAVLWERRLHIKPIALSCTLPNRRHQTWKVSGYVVDSLDGIYGVNATLVNNADKKLLASMAAGALEGGGAYVSQRQLTQTYSAGTGVSSGIVTGSPGAYVAGGAAQGAGKGLQGQVQEYYDLYRSTLQIGGGGEVTVHLTTTLALPEGGEALSTVQAAR